MRDYFIGVFLGAVFGFGWGMTFTAAMLEEGICEHQYGTMTEAYALCKHQEKVKDYKQ